ncbi:DUF5085 family protein [Paenibacillus spiritus]|uniref:DUF5085 family protein n=1 Tax=Paenibacillus spiritus TaxID=2496557 RepID=A0A5J5FVY7_9BACL|nr:DUF5085 family protein [Paenibacillus spiritus]KAA8997932.1 DUF5085 family protein [Paenibacillus spiritus]
MKYLIESGTTLEFENVVALRKKVVFEQMNQEIDSFVEYLRSLGLARKGPFITVTFAVENDGNQRQVIDMEFLVAVDRCVKLHPEYRYLPKFYLTNALLCRYKGSPEDVHLVYESFAEYMSKNGLQPITAYYNVNHDSETGGEIHIDIYVAVNPCLL